MTVESIYSVSYTHLDVYKRQIVKGVKGFDYERAYEAMKTTAMNPNYDCLPEYRMKIGRAHV